jgi:cytochrome c-type biogenesis protein
MSAIILALLAGMLTVTAPCILPMLPILLGTSVGQKSGLRPPFIVLGFSLTFSSFALVFSLFSEVLGLSAETLRDGAVALLLAFGLIMTLPRPFEWLGARLNGLVNLTGAAGHRAGSGNLGGFVLGMTLGVVWTPCAGLASVLTLVATAQHLAWATSLLACYALGAGVPMLGIAYGGQYVSSRVRQVCVYSRRLQQGFGVVVTLGAIAMHYQYDTLITVWLSKFYPNALLGL